MYPLIPFSRRISSIVANGSPPGAYLVAIDQSVSPDLVTTVGTGPAGSAAWLAGQRQRQQQQHRTPAPGEPDPAGPAPGVHRDPADPRDPAGPRDPAAHRRPGTHRDPTAHRDPSSSNGSSIERPYEEGVPDRYDSFQRHDAPGRTDV